MLDSFIKWAKSVETTPAVKTASAKITESLTSDNPSARLDFDTPTSIARITFWESGNYLAEIIDIASERQTFSRQGVIELDSSFNDQFKAFFDVLCGDES